jgi:hypothetical protein
MLPPGHVAAGYLTAWGLLKILKPELSPIEYQQLLLWGAFIGFSPDLDVFYAFLKQRSWLVAHPTTPVHRNYFSHAPVVWAAAGLAVYFLAESEFYKIFGLIVWLSSWSHFALDTLEFGIAWLWPISRRLFAFWGANERSGIEEKNFFRHTILVLKAYTKKISFYLEVLIIITALIVYLN